MNHREVGRYWDGNADAWTKLARAGYDVYRDYLNTPAFFVMLPNVKGLLGLDIGCGECHNTRLLARRGAHSEWLFGAAPPEAKAGLPKFRTPRFTRALGEWFNLLVGSGFLLERVEEPRPSAEAVRACPDVQDAQVVAYFLHVRVRKPAAPAPTCGTLLSSELGAKET